MPDPVIVPLSRSLTVIDQTFTQLKVREPTGLDLMEAGDAASGYGFLARVGARCANIPLEDFGRLPARDALAVTKAITDFLGESTPDQFGTSISKSPDGGAAPLSSS